METKVPKHSFGTRRRSRVVLKASSGSERGSRHRLEVSDGCESSPGAESEAERLNLDCTSLSSRSHYDHTSWAAPVIKTSDHDRHSSTVGGYSPIHVHGIGSTSTPNNNLSKVKLQFVDGVSHSHSKPLHSIRHNKRSDDISPRSSHVTNESVPLQSKSSPVVNANAHAHVHHLQIPRSPRYSSSPDHNPNDSALSDDVFLDKVNTYPLNVPYSKNQRHNRQVHPEFVSTHSNCNDQSFSKTLPVVPNQANQTSFAGQTHKNAHRRRRPKSSPSKSRNSSTDSYPSPLHHSAVTNRSISAVTRAGGDHAKAQPFKRSGSNLTTTHNNLDRGRRKNRRVHPTNQTDGGQRTPSIEKELHDVNSPSPVHSEQYKSTSPSSMAMSPNSMLSGTQRLFSTADSLNMSSAMTPLLTSDLRKGGTNPSLGTTWDFDAESQLESCFPDRHIKVFIVTWNMQEQKELPESLDDLLLPVSHDTAADMFVIGTQESTPSKREWEVLIQQTLGPSYVPVRSSSLGVINMLFYLRRDLIWFCSAVYSSSYATRPVTLIKTKGGLGISFTLFGSSFLFITSHLTAHQSKILERNSDVQRITTNLTFSSGDNSDDKKLNDFDHVFWFGDLNYRVDLTRDIADQHLASSDWMSLLLKDQLTREILQGKVFVGYSEQPITFAPSYKFDLNSDLYDTSEKQRIPSWTDRVLFRSRAGHGISGCGYQCCHTLKCSDHRPVCAIFRVKLEPSRQIEGVPDSVVTFDREIYMRAQQQRKIVAKQLASLQSEEVDGDVQERDSTSGLQKRVTSSVCMIL